MARTTTTDILNTKLTIDGKGYTAGTKKASGDLDTFDRKSKKSFSKIRGSALAATAAIAGMTLVIKKLVKLGAEQERMERRLSFAVQQAGLATATTTKHLLDYASALQRQTTFGDEAIISVQTMMLQLGELSGEELDRATRLTLDFASALGIDLKAAGILMAKAATGSTEALSRYGIILDEGIPKSEKFAELLDLMQSKFGGTAAAETDTLYGSILQTTNAFGDLGEEMGRINSGVLKTAVKFWGEMAASMADYLAGIREAGGQKDMKQLLEGEISRLETMLKLTTPANIEQQLSLLSQITEKKRILASISAAGITGARVPGEGAVMVGGDAGGASVPTGQISALGAFLATQQAETKALLETQAVGLAERADLEAADRENRINIIAENMAFEQEMQLAHSNALIAMDARVSKAKVDNVKLNMDAARMGLQALATAFPKVKALAIGEALVSTYLGITKALGSAPPPLNFAMAALVAAQGFAAVQSIKSQSHSGGGASTYSYGGAVGAVSMPVSGAQSQDINLTIIGAGDLINKEALGQMFFDSFGDLVSATGGRTGDITLDFVEN